MDEVFAIEKTEGVAYEWHSTVIGFTITEQEAIAVIETFTKEQDRLIKRLEQLQMDLDNPECLPKAIQSIEGRINRLRHRYGWDFEYTTYRYYKINQLRAA